VTTGHTYDLAIFFYLSSSDTDPAERSANWKAVFR